MRYSLTADSTLTYRFILRCSSIVQQGHCSMFQAKYRAYLSIRRGASKLIESAAFERRMMVVAVAVRAIVRENLA